MMCWSVVIRPVAALGLLIMLVAPGFAADLVVFDPAVVSDTATYDNPHQYAAGISHVLVNGQFVIRDGSHTGAKPGQVISFRN